MPIDRFIEFLKERAGPSLRVVTWYAEDDFGGLYVRDDLDRQSVLRRVRFLSDRLMRGDGPIGGSPLDELGQSEAMVQLREHAVILRFPLDRKNGILVSLDVDVARDLHGFVMGCNDRLQDVSGGFRPSPL